MSILLCFFLSDRRSLRAPESLSNMTDHDKDPEIQTRSEEKQPSERPKVRLPFVSSMPGNAWAQMRTRERERHEKGLYGLEFGDLEYSTETSMP